MSEPRLAVGLLGGFRLVVEGRAVPEGAWRLRKAQSLVKLLALAPGHRLHREVVLERLWPDRGLEAAHNNLRQALFIARRAIGSCGGEGPAALRAEGEALLLGGEVEVDVDAFESAAAAALGSGQIAIVQAALDRYGGELLPEDRFEEWAAARREALREQHLALLARLASLQERAGDTAAAIVSLQRAVASDPLNEPTQRELMRLYTLAGRRQRALAQYQLLRERLRRELADEPEQATRELYRQILSSGATAIAPGQAGASSPARPAPIGSAAGNLPLQLTSFVGRERELAEVLGLLGRSRLLTLSGPGGCGKTRLALEAAERALARYPDGAWLLELSGLHEGSELPAAVATVLGLGESRGEVLPNTLAAHIGERRMLLLLDTCEHLVGACAELVAALLGACRSLTVLATSRQPLRVAGEVCWRVPSLTLPAKALSAPEELLSSDAVRLFCERAAAAAGGFELDDGNAEDVGEICRRLDGIPLAIELATAGLRTLSPAQLARRMDESLSLLRGGGAGDLTRQQTLRATLDWSWELLGERERVLLRRLGAFAGPFALEAAEAVCADRMLPRERVVETLGGLVEKSLVAIEPGGAEQRYRLLDTVRQYAREQLERAAEASLFRSRHRAFCVGLAEETASGLTAPDPTPALLRLASVHEELREALRSGTGEQPQEALRIAAAAWRFWLSRMPLTEARAWLRAALARAPQRGMLRARVLRAESVLCFRLSDEQGAYAAAQESLEISRECGERLFAAEALGLLGAADWLFSRGDPAARYTAGLELARAAGDQGACASALHSLGVLAATRGREHEADGLLEQSLEQLRQIPAGAAQMLFPVTHGLVLGEEVDGRPPRVRLEATAAPMQRLEAPRAAAHVLLSRANAARQRGEHALARELLEEALAMLRTLSDQVGVARALIHLGYLSVDRGEGELARELLEESISLAERHGDRRARGLALLAQAEAAARLGEREHAHSQLGRARGLFEAGGDMPGRTAALQLAGELAAGEERFDQARELWRSAAAAWRGLGHDSREAGWALVTLSWLHERAGEREQASAALRQAARDFAEIGELRGLAWCDRAAAGGRSSRLRPSAANAPLTAAT